MDNKLGDFINKNFVSIKINGKKDAGPELKKQLSVYGYPTIVFVAPDGNEVDRISGWDGNTQNFLATLKAYLAGEGTLKSLLTQYESEPDNLELNSKLAEKYLSRWESSKAVPYFQNILRLDPENSYNFADKANCYIALNDVWTNEDPKATEEFIKNCTSDELLRKSFSELIRFFENKKDVENTLRIYDSYLNHFKNDTGIMNGYAWYIYEERLTDKYDFGIEIAKKAVSLEPDAAHIWDTLAWLQFESAQMDDAIKSMEKAVELEPSEDSFKKSLEKIKAGKNS